MNLAKSVNPSKNLHDPVGNTDVLLHVSVRPEEGKIVLNSKKDGVWGSEETYKVPIDNKTDFDINIKTTEKSFEIEWNGSFLAEFSYRLPLEEWKMVVVYKIFENSYFEKGNSLGRSSIGITYW